MAKVRSKPKAGKTWRSKLEAVHPSHGSIEPVPEAWAKRLGKGTMLIPRPLDVDAELRRVRKGQLTTVGRIRARLAAAAGADHACPLTTGIFLRIAAEAAEEDRAAGKRRITPYWRTIRDDGRLLERVPGGEAAQARKLEEEGFTIEHRKGRRPRVQDFEKHVRS
jgi:alkylated DNA nucleotide flippase Atl1